MTPYADLSPVNTSAASAAAAADAVMTSDVNTTAPSAVGYNASRPEVAGGAPPFSCENVSQFHDYFTYCSDEFRLISSIKLYSLPLFVVVGSVGNAVCLAALSQKSASQSSVGVYMAAVTVLHTVVLYMGCGLEWYSFVTHQIHPLHTVDWLCRLFHFSFNVVRCAAWWVLVAMTVDAHLGLWCAARARQLCTSFVAKFATTAILVWLVSLHVHAMWIYEVRDGMCRLDAARRDFETVVWPWITAVFSHYLPIAVVAVFLPMLAVGLAVNSHDHSTASRHPDQRRAACLTVLMAVMFLGTTLPTIVMNFIDQSQPVWQVSDDRLYWTRHARYILCQVIFSTLESLYVTICFALFLAAFPSLRGELAGLFRHVCCTRARRQTDDRANGGGHVGDRLIEINSPKADSHQNNKTTSCV